MTPPLDDPSVALWLPDCLDIAARNWPDRLALEFAGQRWPFRHLAAAVDRAAAQLALPAAMSNGRLGILSANRSGFVVAIHAARQNGIPIVPLNWRQTADEIAWQIADADISLLLVDEEHAPLAGAAVAGQSVTMLPIAELEDSAQPPRLPASPTVLASDRPDHDSAELRQPRLIAADREIAVIYTSGASGRPKGARLTYGNFWFSAVASALHLGHLATDVWLAALPLFHVGGLSILFRGAISGVPVILHPRFDPAATLAAIDDGATLVSLVPTMLSRLLETRGDTPWPATLRCILLGGAATPLSLVASCRARGLPVAPTYGLTEAASQVTTLVPEEVNAKPGSSGRPLPLTRLRIQAEVNPGEIGEIEISGPTVFAGYLHQSAGMNQAEREPWFSTGDMGYLDDDGYLFVVDRRGDLIVSGGENIYPAEIERVLLEHPLVRDAAVVGLPDEVWGSRPAAAIVWSGDLARLTETLTEHCRQRLAPYKMPVRYVAVEHLPRTVSGKLLRHRVRDLFDPAPH